MRLAVSNRAAYKVQCLRVDGITVPTSGHYVTAGCPVAFSPAMLIAHRQLEPPPAGEAGTTILVPAARHVE